MANNHINQDNTCDQTNKLLLDTEVNVYIQISNKYHSFKRKTKLYKYSFLHLFTAAVHISNKQLCEIYTNIQVLILSANPTYNSIPMDNKAL